MRQNVDLTCNDIYCDLHRVSSSLKFDILNSAPNDCSQVQPKMLNISRRHKNVKKKKKKVAPLNKLKRYLFTVSELKKTECQHIWRQLGICTSGNEIFPTSMYVYEWSQMHQEYWFRGYKWILTSRQIHKYTINKSWVLIIQFFPN